MFEWSKEVSDKIAESGCISDKDMQVVEMALRMYEIHEKILNESIGITDDNFWELKYQIYKNRKNKQ